MLLLRHKEEYLDKYQNIVMEIQRMVLSMENVSCKIFGDECVGHKCMDITVAKSPHREEQETCLSLSMD